MNKRDLDYKEAPQELEERPWLEPHKFAQFQRRAVPVQNFKDPVARVSQQIRIPGPAGGG